MVVHTIAVGQLGAVGIRPYYQAAGQVLSKQIIVWRSRTLLPAPSKAAHCGIVMPEGPKARQPGYGR